VDGASSNLARHRNSGACLRKAFNLVFADNEADPLLSAWWRSRMEGLIAPQDPMQVAFRSGKTRSCVSITTMPMTVLNCFCAQASHERFNQSVSPLLPPRSRARFTLLGHSNGF